MKDIDWKIATYCSEFTAETHVSIAPPVQRFITEIFHGLHDDYQHGLTQLGRDAVEMRDYLRIVDHFANALPLYLRVAAGIIDSSVLLEQIPPRMRTSIPEYQWKLLLDRYFERGRAQEIRMFLVIQFLRIWLPYITASCWPPFEPVGAND